MSKSNPQIDKIVEVFAKLFTALNRPRCPTDGICSHLGVTRWAGGDRVSLSKQGNNLLVMIYREKNLYKNDLQIGYPAEHHNQVIRAIEKVVCSVHKEARVVDRWNGLTGHNGVSFVFAGMCPTSLLIGIGNYHKMVDVFHITKADKLGYRQFDTWLRIGLGKLKPKKRRKRTA